MAYAIISARQTAWNAAHAALSEHRRAHREARAWHPFGTPARAAADLRQARVHRRLKDAETESRESLASAHRALRTGFAPEPSGLFALI